MARVLPFVRGIDFSGNDFQEDNFPKEISMMTGLRWLRLNDSKVDWIPEEFALLDKLETIHLARNNLVTLHGELVALNALRSLICRHNQINDKGLPEDLFKGEDELSVLDFSHNCLTTTPFGLEKCKSLLVLNLSCNCIKTIPNQLFINLIDLLYLNLSHNQLETLPPQMRRLIHLQELDLSNNPLGHNQLKLLQSLNSLQSLNLSYTERTFKNMPTSLANLTNLTELNLAHNAFCRVPDVIYTLNSLKRLNLSDNCISELASDIDEHLPNLEVLNLSRNQISALPQNLSKLEKLRCLYLNYNKLDFEGIPNSIGKLFNLEVFMASDNNLELIPEGLFRCGKLKTLILANNNLITLPDAIHLLNDLKVLDLTNNPNLSIPPKPAEVIVSSNKLYNIDQVLASQLRNVQPTTTSNAMEQNSQITPTKDPIARKKRLVSRAKEKASESDSSKVLKGMTDLANNKTSDVYEVENEQNLKPKRWEDNLTKPPIDYRDFFDEDVGQYPGLVIWEIDNFNPSRIDEALHGKFYEGDCYIVLSTEEDDNLKSEWQIFYWIGMNSSLDKKASAAMHAVNLRNFLSAHCRTIREEQNDESESFMELFPKGVTYICGERTASGFFTNEGIEFSSRLYRLHELSLLQLYMQTVPLKLSALDSRFVYILDLESTIFVWNGKKSKFTVRQKGRLLAEKMNEEEHKNKCEVIHIQQGKELSAFWDALELDVDVSAYNFVVPCLNQQFHPPSPIIYEVCLGSGYLELPQVHYKPKPLSKKHFNTKNVYIMDCFSDVYIWQGRKAHQLLRAAGLRLVPDLFTMIKRPEYAVITRCMEGVETQSFKSCFPSWDEANAVDYTRTITSVRKIGANVDKWVSEHSQQKCDFSALFMPRPAPMSKEEAQGLSDEWNEDLENMDVFVYDKKYVKLPKQEFGHFFSGESYAFICRYVMSIPIEGGKEDEEEEFEDIPYTMVYFWQGRDASINGWSVFLFELKPRFESMFGAKLKIEIVKQQQENIKFLSHFRRQFIIHKGFRNRSALGQMQIARNEPELFHLRSNGGPLTLRTIQISIEEEENVLYSAFCYILKIPPQDEMRGQVFIWTGAQADVDDVEVAKEIVNETYDPETYDTVVVNEGDDLEAMSQYLPNLIVDTDCQFLNHARLFRCGINEKGYFSISEKYTDFCQDDLSNDIMLLDNGEQVFLWFGLGDMDPLTKLEQAKKSAQVYVQNMKIKEPDRPRTLMFTVKGKETRQFRKCFHGWSSFHKVRDDRETRDAQQLKIIYPKTGKWFDRFKKAESSSK